MTQKPDEFWSVEYIVRVCVGEMATLKLHSKTARASSVQTIKKSLRAIKPIDVWQLLMIYLLTAHIQNEFNGRSMMPMCAAGPVPTSLVLPPTSSADSPIIHVVNLTRQHGGDIFTAFGKLTAIFQRFFFYSIYNHFASFSIIRCGALC